MSVSDRAAVLRAGFSGDLILPGGDGYDACRQVFNGMHDRRPALIARCASAADVAAAIAFARQERLTIAIRCGGHSVAGLSTCEDGLLIDLAGLNAITVDPVARTARAGGGVLWGAFDAATQAHGLHTPGGRVTTTGLGGFTTGGGYGWTSSRYGLACDNLIAAQVVLADGSLVTASEEQHADLFWGIRGGGGNFGVVTEFTFRLHPLGPIVFAGLMLFPIDRAAEVVRAWRDFADAAPDTVSTGCAIVTAPPEPFVPDALKGQVTLGLMGMYVGDPAEGAASIQPLRALGPAVDLMQPMPYTAFQAITDAAAPKGLRNYWRGEYLDTLSDDAIDVYVTQGAALAAASAPLGQMIVFRVGQAVSAVAEDATAFSHRAARYLFHPITIWPSPADDARLVAGNRAFCDAMRPFTTGGAYLNFTPEDVRAGFGDAKYARLQALKDRYDPHNVFCLTRNIAPNRGATASGPA
jgi:FAD/FMN-containing dehydrogenase